MRTIFYLIIFSALIIFAGYCDFVTTQKCMSLGFTELNNYIPFLSTIIFIGLLISLSCLNCVKDSHKFLCLIGIIITFISFMPAINNIMELTKFGVMLW